MNTTETKQRVIESVALFLIGDGVMGLIKPRRHSMLWNCGPKPVRQLTESLAEHPQLGRGIYLGEIALGLLLAFKQTP